MSQETSQAISPESSAISEQKSLTAEQKRTVIGIIAAVIIALAFLIAGVIYLLQPGTDTGRFRDIFIILMAIMSLVTSLALVILIVQLARLINLIQNEVRPILNSTNETVSHLRGTTVFLTDNLVEPVLKMNEYLAGLSQFLKVVGLLRKQSKEGSTKGE